MKSVTIFTDGAAKGNPGPGGYGAVLVFGDMVQEIGEAKNPTTNNEMELRAVVAALQVVPDNVTNVAIYTDSKYVVEGATGWTFGWVKNGWKTKAGSDVLHKEVWQALMSELKRVTVEWHKVPGHVGIVGNERADTIASDFGAGKSVELYQGAKSAYPYDVDNVSYDEAAAAKRSEARKRQSQKAYSYISALDGEVQIHATWAECEARVRGKKGARFKKAVTAAEEQEIIQDFS